MSNVVVLIGDATSPNDAVSSALSGDPVLESLPTGFTDSVSLVSWLPAEPALPGIDVAVTLGDSPAPIIDRTFAAVGAIKAQQRFAQYPVGRLINSFAPADQSRVFWRRFRRNEEALALLNSTTFVIAADLSAVKTAWTLLKTGRVGQAFYGLSATTKELNRRQ